MINGYVAHDSGQSGRLKGKNGPHFKAFTTWKREKNGAIYQRK